MGRGNVSEDDTMTTFLTLTRRRVGRSLVAAAALTVAVAITPMAGAAPAPIEIPLQTGVLTVNGFTMNWPAPSVTGAKLVGTWDAETGALDADLVSEPVTLTYPQLTGGEGTVTMTSAGFVGTVLPGEEGEVTGTVSVEVVSNDEFDISRCATSGDITFTSTLIPVAGGFGLTLAANGFDFPLGSGYASVPGSPDLCIDGFTEAATGTPTSSTALVINGFVAETPPAPEPPAPTPPAPTPATPKFTG